MSYDGYNTPGYSGVDVSTMSDFADDWGTNWGSQEAANLASQGPRPDFYIQNRMSPSQMGRRNMESAVHPTQGPSGGIPLRGGDYYSQNAFSRAANPTRWGFVDQYGTGMSDDGILEWNERERHHRLKKYMDAQHGGDYTFEQYLKEHRPSTWMQRYNPEQWNEMTGGNRSASQNNQQEALWELNQGQFDWMNRAFARTRADQSRQSRGPGYYNQFNIQVPERRSSAKMNHIWRDMGNTARKYGLTNVANMFTGYS